MLLDFNASLCAVSKVFLCVSKISLAAHRRVTLASHNEGFIIRQASGLAYAQHFRAKGFRCRSGCSLIGEFRQQPGFLVAEFGMGFDNNLKRLFKATVIAPVVFPQFDMHQLAQS